MTYTNLQLKYIKSNGGKGNFDIKFTSKGVSHIRNDKILSNPILRELAQIELVFRSTEKKFSMDEFGNIILITPLGKSDFVSCSNTNQQRTVFPKRDSNGIVDEGVLTQLIAWHDSRHLLQIFKHVHDFFKQAHEDQSKAIKKLIEVIPPKIIFEDENDTLEKALTYDEETKSYFIDVSKISEHTSDLIEFFHKCYPYTKVKEEWSVANEFYVKLTAKIQSRDMTVRGSIIGSTLIGMLKMGGVALTSGDSSNAIKIVSSVVKTVAGI